MARIRTIKPGFFKNEDIAALPAMTRLLFIGLWTQADRAGRFEDRPKRLKAEIFPYDSYDIEKGLNELQKAGFILRYKANVNISDRVLAPEQPVTELALIQIINFSKHQQPNVKETNSALPAPCRHHASIMPALQEQEYGKEGNGFNSHARNSETLPNEPETPPPIAPPAGFFPGPEHMGMILPEMKIGTQIQRIRLTKRVSIDEGQVIGLWAVFKQEYFTGKKYYENEDAIYSHFGNWLKDQKFSNANVTGRQSISGSIDAVSSAFADLQRDLDASMRGGSEDP